MENNKKRLGILGGAFDPPHFGHLGLALEARYQLSLDRIVWIPAGQPPHKNPITGPQDRLAMTRLVTCEYPFFEVSDIEINDFGPHYTVDTLKKLKTIFVDWELFLLLGEDAADLSSWKEPQTIEDLATIVIASRLESFSLANEKNQKYNFKQKPVFLHWPGISVASNELRQRINDEAPIDYLVPRSVKEYVRRARLYR